MINYHLADLVSRLNNSTSNSLFVPVTKDNSQFLTVLANLGVIKEVLPAQPSASLNEVTFPHNPRSPGPQSPSGTSPLKGGRGAPYGAGRRVQVGCTNLLVTKFSSKDSSNTRGQAGVAKLGLKLISKPGKRIYISHKDLVGATYIVRTSQGILSSQTALKLKLGGELLAKLV